MSKKSSFHLSIVFVFLTALILPLLPSGPEIQPQENPFFKPFKTPFDTPPFERIQVSHYLPAIKEGIRQHQDEIDAIVNNTQPASFQNTIEALDRAGQLLSRVNRVFRQLLGAVNSREMQEVANQSSPLLSAHFDNIQLNTKLFLRVKSVYDQRSKLKLSPQQLYLLENAYREFIRSGALLDDKQKIRMREINQEHDLLVLKFNDNLLAETNDSNIVIEKKADLDGLPESVILMGEETGKSMNMPGKWVFTAQRPSWTPFLQYASRRDLRRSLYSAYFMLCNRDNDRDNKAILQKIIEFRCERSKMLGYPTPAHFYLEDRMAKTPENVNSFLMRLWNPALERGKSESKELQALVDKENGGFKLSSWDWFYYAEKVRKAKYALDDSMLRPYFQLENVQKGAFLLAEKLYGLKFAERKDISVYHPEVRVFEVKEGDGNVLGILYVDSFPRASKRGGAWSGSFRSAYYQSGKRVIPLATLVCNSTRPTAIAPSLLSIDEVNTYFHEFGHALKTLFANGIYHSYDIPRDIVELPSQIMENWALEPEMLKLYARHYKTNEIIPDSLIEKIKKSVLFNQGFETVEYLAACFLDMAWHSLETAKNLNVTRFEEKVMSEIGLMDEIIPRYHSTYFSHIMGGYIAGYYSYIWAGVLDSDAFEAFRETSLFNKNTAASFRKNILEKLGTEDSMTLYRRFRGREPKIEPLLRKRGI